KSQIFVFAGCGTYVGYSDKIFEHPNKRPENTDVITTVNYSTSVSDHRSVKAFLGSIMRMHRGTWYPNPWSTILKDINKADANNYWTAMFGVHGLSANPRLSPLADVAIV